MWNTTILSQDKKNDSALALIFNFWGDLFQSNYACSKNILEASRTTNHLYALTVTNQMRIQINIFSIKYAYVF